jgi:hypothetical protein
VAAEIKYEGVFCVACVLRFAWLFLIFSAFGVFFFSLFLSLAIYLHDM